MLSIVFAFALAGCNGVTDVNKEESINKKAPAETKYENEAAGKMLGMVDLSANESWLFDPETGKRKDLLPPGYNLVFAYAYADNREYVVAEKDSQLFVVNVKNNEINELSIPSKQKDEKIRFNQSLTDKSKLFVKIQKQEPVEGMYGYRVLESRNYFVNAESGEVTPADNLKAIDEDLDSFGSCYEYDSLHSRFFLWQCGEGIGSATPLETYDYLTNERKTIFNKERLNAEFPIGVYVDDNQFVLMSSQVTQKDGTTHRNKWLFVIKPTPNPEVIEYEWSDDLDIINPYSITQYKDLNRFVIGGGSAIQIISYDENRQIDIVKQIDLEALYLNFPMPIGRLFYFTKDQKLFELNVITGELIEKATEMKGELFAVFGMG